MRPALSRNQFAIALAVAVAVLAFAPARPVRADSGYAALLVLFGPEDYHTECIALPGNMTAFDLVRASTLSATIESPTNAADAICSIDGVGCVYPGEACFCQCNADACALWTEWYSDVNRWEIAFDADERIIPNGAVEAWVWGDGMTEPPIVSFADICTGVVPDDSPEAPTATPPANPGYPGPSAATPTFWVTPTRSAAATATATRTATTLGQPGSQFTPSAGAATPSATRFATPTWMAPSPTSTTVASGAQATPTMDGETSVTTLAEAPSGSPTPDQVAMLIDASAARVRATALAVSSQSGVPRRGNGGTWVLGSAAVVLVAYALFLRRQRRLDAAETAALAPLDQAGAEPAEPSSVSAEQTDGASSEPPARDVAPPLDVDDGQDAL